MIIGGWRGPGWRVTAADPRLGSVVRAWIRSAIGGHDCAVDAADAALVVSELFGNACLYGPAGGFVLVGYCLWREGARLVVCDGGGPGVPRLVRGDGLAEGGRGMHVVDGLAARWGSFRLPGAQVVWTDLGQPLRVPDSDAWSWLRLCFVDLFVVRARPTDRPPPDAGFGGGGNDVAGDVMPGRTL